MVNILTRLPFNRPPNNVQKHWGWGLAPIAASQWDDTVAAAKNLIDIINADAMPAADQSTLDSISAIKGRFARVYLTDQSDWYSSSRLLGHPSGAFSRAAASALQDLRQAIKEQDSDMHLESLEFLRSNYVSDMLDNFLNLAAGEYPVVEEGCAYIVWSARDRDILHIGATEGQIDDVINRLNAESPFYRPYGVLASWLVHDPEQAQQDIERSLEKFSIGNGAYLTGLGLSRNIITGILADTDNTVLSPWHAIADIPKPNVIGVYALAS